MFAVLIGLIGGLFLWLLYLSHKSHRYWKEKCIPFVKPLPILGSSLKMFLLQQNQAALYEQIYKNNDDKPYVGLYECTQPVLLIRDPALIGRILVKDFNNFVDHGFGEVPKSEVDAGLFILQGDEWRAVRHKMVPVFTTGKLRNMFPQMVTCSNLLLPLINAKSTDVDIMEVATAYSMSVIASCAFGIDVETGKDSTFRKMGRKFFDMPLRRYIKILLIFVFPKLASKWNITFTPDEVGKYFGDIIKETFKYRKDNKIVRNDFVQLLMQLKEQGSVEIQTRDKEDDYLNPDESIKNIKNIEMTDQLLISQAFTFITAGFEGMTINIMYTLLELAQAEDLQTRARNEIENLIAKYGELTYDGIKEATFLSLCLDEALRKYPLAPILFRICTKRYELEEGIFIEPGIRVVMSAAGLHMDPTYWQRPDKYDPDRFVRDPIVPNTYIPFGDGPRMCIGMRFALLEIKLGLAVILYNYKVKLSPKTKLPITMDVRSFFSKPSETVYFNFEKINR